MNRKRYILIIFVLFFTSSCAILPEKIPLPTLKRGVVSERGTASWYGKDFHGRRTANGEIYNMYGNSAAHKTLPFGTVVSVENLDNGKTLTTRINDRGPFIRGRIIDLSYGAAKEIKMIGPGVARVRVSVLKWGDGKYKKIGTVKRTKKTVKSPVKQEGYSEGYSVQVGSFSNRDNAIKLKRRLEKGFKDVHIKTRETNRATLYSVRIGYRLGEEHAKKLAEKLEQENLPTFITAD